MTDDQPSRAGDLNIDFGKCLYELVCRGQRLFVFFHVVKIIRCRTEDDCRLLVLRERIGKLQGTADDLLPGCINVFRCYRTQMLPVCVDRRITRVG